MDNTDKTSSIISRLNRIPRPLKIALVVIVTLVGLSLSGDLNDIATIFANPEASTVPLRKISAAPVIEALGLDRFSVQNPPIPGQENGTDFSQ